MSVRFRKLFDLLDEAEFYRQQSVAEFIEREHVERALKASDDRSGRIRQAMLDDTLNNTIVINTDGERIGEVNGLTVWEIGDSRFGATARISASAYPGSRGVVDVEREVELGQAIHSKGVMILTGYLGSKYAENFPLTLSANIALEQSYGYVDGDSAALAEICCLLSAIAKLPLTQRYALTGSINQNGEVQAVGGINEKVEGFFRLCKARGLSGKQGVIIPQANICNLVLNQEVLTAMEAGSFTLYAVSHVDQAMELLSGKRAGKRTASGRFSKGSFNAMIEQRLQAFLKMPQQSHRK
jgi:predicted ATP-dependent protease